MTDAGLIDLVGRMLMIGLPGETMDGPARELLRNLRPGGLILFKRNVGGGPGQVQELLARAQELAVAEFGRRLLTAIDQEGGTVRRLGPPFAQLPSQREMAKLPRELVRRLGETSGRELAAVGLNLNLTPVLDLAVDPDAFFMADRSFGPDPELASRMALALIDGHAEYGVLTCGKHFPGIGDTRLDPHEELPTVNHGLMRLKTLELAPFINAFKHGLAAVMTAHVNFPALDPDWPGTFSHKILTGLLRRELDFKGLILSDDLEMGAVVKHFALGPAAVQAVRAGCDLLLVCQKPELIRQARDGLLAAVRCGELPVSRLEESAARLETALSRIPPHPLLTMQEVFGHAQIA
jgi:beta-N-acetylhexosaminidase